MQTGPFRHAFMESALAARENRRRLVETDPGVGALARQEGRELVNFSSNDYLGLSRHPLLAERAGAYALRHGTGAGASRLVCGSLPIHRELEERLAAFTGREAALLFASGYQANATVLPALLGRGDRVLADRMVHHSLLHGIRASGARLSRYPHQDLDRLEELLRNPDRPYGRAVIVTETVFSMDGDRSDVGRLAELADRFGAFLYLDEAHAFGILGPGGAGLAAGHPRVDAVLGTFGKACGGFGAFVAGPALLWEYLVNFCGGFIYSTALPPPVVGAASAALDLLPGMESERHLLQAGAEELRRNLRRLGRDTLASTTQIVPLVAGSSAAAVSLSRELERRGILGVAIRPPTVPEGTARVRLSLTASHRPEHLQRLVEALERPHGPG